MSNREKIMWALFSGLLVLLFIMSSTDLIIKEKKAEVYSISVIISQSRDDYYGNFKKGIDKAAEELRGDVNFITLYTSNSEEEQLELVAREIRDGARAIILEPVRGGETVMALEELKPSCPVVLLGAESPESFVAGSILTERDDMGRMLGEAAVGRVKPGETVYLFAEGLANYGVSNIYDGVRKVLEEHDCAYRVYEGRSEDAYRQAIESTVYPGNERITVAALDADALYETSRILESSSVYQRHVSGLYGVGDTMAILNQLDAGIIDGIVTSNRFNEGYLSVKCAIEAIEGNWSNRQSVIEAYYLERGDLRDKAYEKMLYPMD